MVDTKYGKLVLVGTENIVDGAVTAAKLGSDVSTTLTATDTSITVTGGGAKVSTGKLKTKVMAGAAAGDHSVTGITAADELLAVIFTIVSTGTLTVADLTSEFTVGTGKINNAAGTDTTGGFLEIRYLLRH